MNYTNRSIYLYKFKTENDKQALEQLILTYNEYIKNVVIKYNYYDSEELISVGLESVLNTILKYENNKNLTLLNARILKHLYLDINNFIKNNPSNESYETYSQQIKNNENFSYKLNILEPVLKEELQKELQKLTPFQKKVIETRYKEKYLTLIETSKILGKSFQYIQQEEKKALKKLSKKSELIKFYK